MFYQINGKPYVKNNGKYVEVMVTINSDNKIIFVPTNNTLSIHEVGRNYKLISYDTLRVKLVNEMKNNN